MKNCFYKESKDGLKFLFDMSFIALIATWPLIIASYIILFIINPFHNPTTIDMTLKELYWNMGQGQIYIFGAAGLTFIYDIVIAIPLIRCYIVEEQK